MFYFVLTIHLILCILIIGLVLLQQGKGAQVGAILSGSSNTLFGAAGASTTLAKLTTWFAIAFFATSVILIKIYGSGGAASVRVAAPVGTAAGALEGTVLGEMVKQQQPVEPAAAAGSSVVSASSAAAVAETNKNAPKENSVNLQTGNAVQDTKTAPK